MAAPALNKGGGLREGVQATPTVKDGVKYHEGTTWTPGAVVGPALAPSVELSVTIVFITIYALLFLFVYVQLWMIWYYRHKRFSYQTVFLFTCLVWSGLRTTLFSFYFNDCKVANQLPIMFYWLLYCFPVCLQFTMLCLLVLFFAQVVFKARAKYEPSKYKKPLRFAVLGAVLVFVTSNLVCGVIVRIEDSKLHSSPLVLNIVRVAVNDTLFIITAVALSVCIIKMTKMSSSNLVLEAKGTSVIQAVAVSVMIVLLFSSRAVYNFITISLQSKGLPGFGYDWINVSDQADYVHNLSETYGYVSFGIVLFIWEFMPIAIVVLFFRVKRQSSDVNLSDFSTSSHGSKVFFFDNPRRYDSDEDLPQADSRSRSVIDSGSYSINDSPSLRNTPNGTLRGGFGTPIHRGSFRSPLRDSPHPASYGATFSGGDGGLGGMGASPLHVGSVPARVSTSNIFPRVRSTGHMSLLTDPVMSPASRALLTDHRPPAEWYRDVGGRQVSSAHSKGSENYSSVGKRI